MTEVPFMKMWWGDFFGDPKVKMLPGETRAVWSLLLGAMWQNGGWLPDNDAIIARLLGMHLLTWKRRHKPLLTPLLTHGVSPLVTGGVWTQKRLSKEWREAVSHIDVTNKKLAKARAEKAAKSKKPASMAEPLKTSTEEPSTEPSTEAFDRGPQPEPDNRRALPSQAESPSISAPAANDSALRPAPNGLAEGSALNGSHGLEGRSPPEPSVKAEVPPMKHSDIRSGAVEPTPALLRSKLVKVTGLMAALQEMPKEDDDDHQQA